MTSEQLLGCAIQAEESGNNRLAAYCLDEAAYREWVDPQGGELVRRDRHTMRVIHQLTRRQQLDEDVRRHNNV